MISLILMEGLKCAIGLGFVVALFRLSTVLETYLNIKPVKGRQLSYVKSHQKWLIIIGIILVFFAIIGIYFAKEIEKRKKNYTQLWIDRPIIESRLKRLEGFYE